MFYTYGYDGSGVALRCGVEVIADRGKTAWVRFTGFVPPVDQHRVAAGLERVITDTSWEVQASSLTTDRDPHLASFNFLD